MPEKTERQVKLLQATESMGVKCCVCNARMDFVAGTVYSFASGLNWYEQPGDNLSKTHSQLEICERTFEILQEVGSALKTNAFFPAALVRRRMRFLRQAINALRLSAASSPVSSFVARLMLLYFRGVETLYWQLPSTPKMATQKV